MRLTRPGLSLITKKVLRSGLAVIGFGAVALSAFAPGCYGRECDGDSAEYGLNPGEGELINTNTWETTSQTSTAWLEYPHQRTWVFHPHGLEGRGIVNAFVYISPDSDPNQGGNNFTMASGNLAELTILGDSVFVYNNTCASYHMRLVLEAYPPASFVAPDASTSDAPTDGPAPPLTDATPE